MATFVLVHGAWHGAWCWHEIVRRLESRGHRALAIDLPGHGEDRTPAERVVFGDYTATVIAAVRSVDSPPVLVGHSMGGIVCAQVAEDIPEGIQALVALASPPPVDGVPMIKAVEAADPEYLSHFLWAPDGRSARIQPQGIRDFLYQCCPLEFVELAISRCTPEPVTPFTTPIRISPERYWRVRHYYIGCSQDRVVTREIQQRAISRLTPRSVYKLDTDHAPFFSSPEELASCLHAIAQD